MISICVKVCMFFYESSFIAFLALEVAIGMYFPAMSYLKSQIIPEGHRANVMNWFRVPMNIITCTALMSLNLEFFAHDKRLMFGICFILSLLGLAAWSSFRKIVPDSVGGTNNAETSKLITSDGDSDI